MRMKIQQTTIPYEQRLHFYNEMSKNTRLVETGLKGEDQFEILSSVIGQCSDGIYENSPSVEPYWRFSSVLLNPDTEEVEIRISKSGYDYAWMKRGYISNPFTVKTDQEIRNWFARKIKTIINIEAKDKGTVLKFSKKNGYKMQYLGTWENTVGEAVEVYNSLKNKNNK